MDSADPVSVDALPIVEDIAVEVAPASSGVADPMAMDVDGIGMGSVDKEPKEVVDPAAVVYEIPELAALGRAFRSSKPVMLTESETEYVVQCVKHIFANHVVLQ